MKTLCGLFLIVSILACGCSDQSKLVGKWSCVGRSTDYKPKAIEFFKDKTLVIIVDKSTGEYTYGGTYSLLDDGRVKMDIGGWYTDFALFNGKMLTMDGVVYQKSVTAN